jgi:hypothetical protein
MQSIYSKEIEKEKSLKIEKGKFKEFPKISDIDRDEKPKKKPKNQEPSEGINLYSPFTPIISSSVCLEKSPLVLESLKQISAKAAEKISIINKNGITKMHFTIQTKAFDLVDIQITLYNSAPMSYHIALFGNEKIMELSMQHQNILQNQIKQSIPRIQVHLAPPVLRKKDRFTTKAKKSFEKSSGSCYGAVNRIK